ncbi:hypothetical protein EDC01DRAFT_617062 [Geopyxis carbonaria]|nr:hypothetical protein EDC01DRAFT_617062 [Geopyxis carbonaria]
MQQGGFRSAPIAKGLLSLLVLNSLLASLTSIKPKFHLQIVPHLLHDHQFTRLFSFQAIYANSGELLFASLLLYHLRIIERIFGSRKFLSLLCYSYAATSILVPLVLFVGWALTGGSWNYVPPGPTPLLFALLAQYHAIIPSTYRMTVSLPASGDISLTDKLYTYILAAQLAGCQLPGSTWAAAVGWIVGYAWRLDLVPGTRWRIGRDIVRMLGGEAGQEGYENLRARLRGDTGRPEERRPIAMRVLDTFRGAF